MTTVIVTGAGGSIGSAVARRLGAEGYDLALIDRDGEAVTALAEELAGIAYVADLSSPDDIASTFETVFANHQRVTRLFANAGYVKFGSFLDTDRKNWDRHLSVNLSGTFAVCQQFAHRRTSPGPASIVVNASSAATQYSRDLFAYSVTKAGLVMLVKAMATELGEHGLRANAILPGVIDTRMTSSALSSERVRAGLEQRTPLRRLGTPEDVAELTSFLLSDRSDFITGAAVAIDGGQTLVGEPQWV